jgi:hypothetical protein
MAGMSSLISARNHVIVVVISVGELRLVAASGCIEERNTGLLLRQ